MKTLLWTKPIDNCDNYSDSQWFKLDTNVSCGNQYVDCIKQPVSELLLMIEVIILTFKKLGHKGLCGIGMTNTKPGDNKLLISG